MGDLLGQYTINALKLKAQMVYQYIEEHHQTIQGTGLSKIDLAKFTLVRPFFLLPLHPGIKLGYLVNGC